MNKIILLLCTALSLAGCVSAPPVIPKTATVVIEHFKPLPPWATDQVPNPQLAGHTVADHLKVENDRGAVVDFQNCIRSLLKKLDDGQKVNLTDCPTPER